MFRRKRALKSNTNDLHVRGIGFENVKKFEELMRRTGKDNELDAFVMVIDLLESQLPQIPVGKKIPDYVMKWREQHGFVELAEIDELFDNSV